MAWWSPEVWSPFPWTHAIHSEVAKVLARPVTRRRSEELPDGTIGEAIETLEPDGSVEHATAALLSLPGATMASESQLQSMVRSDEPEDATPDGP